MLAGSALLAIAAVMLFHLSLLTILSVQMVVCTQARRTKKPKSSNNELRKLSGDNSEWTPVKRPLPAERTLDRAGQTTDAEETENGETTDMPMSMIKPRKFAKDYKQTRIAMGEMREKTDYPTFSDVLSDWSSTSSNRKAEQSTVLTKTSATVFTKPSAQRSLRPQSLPADFSGQQAITPTTEIAERDAVGAKPEQGPSSELIEEKNPAGAVLGKANPATILADPMMTKVLFVKPADGYDDYFTERGGSNVLCITNLTDDRLVYKARCTNNKLYRMNPVHGFVDARGSLRLVVKRSPGPAKRDRLEICYRKAPSGSSNAKQLFAEDNTFLGIATFPLTHK